MELLLIRLVLTLASLTLSATYDVADYGAIPDDGVSDSQAFRDCLADACDDVAEAEVLAGAGEWLLARIDNRAGVYVAGCTDVVIQGAACGESWCGDTGAATVFTSDVGALSGDRMMFAFDGGSGITLRDFECDGRKGSISAADEQTHCIEFVATDDTLVERAHFHDMWGDSIKYVVDIGDDYPVGSTVLDTLHLDNGRSGIAFNGAQTVLVERLHADRISDQAIDMEPGLCLSDVTIRDSYLGTPASAGAATLSLSGGSCATSDVLVQNTTIMGGVHGITMDGITLDNVRIIADGTGKNGIEFQGQAHNITIADSEISTDGSYDAISMAANIASGPATVAIRRVRTTVARGRGLNYEGGAGALIVDGFAVRSHNYLAQSSGVGVRIASTQASPAMSSLTLTSLDVGGVRYGVSLTRGGGAAPISSCTFAGTADLTGVASSVGVLCSASGLATWPGLSITADTSSSGCN